MVTRFFIYIPIILFKFKANSFGIAVLCYINTNEMPDELSHKNMKSSRVKLKSEKAAVAMVTLQVK